MAVPLGLGFGRMGCLLAGCCFGAPTAGAWGLSFPRYSPASRAQFEGGLLESAGLVSLPVHPAQVYEAVGSLLISAFCLFFLGPRKRYDGQVFLAFIALYAGLRFVLEFWRSDARGEWLWFSTSQWIGLALLVGALWLHLRQARKVAPPPTRA